MSVNWRNFPLDESEIRVTLPIFKDNRNGCTYLNILHRVAEQVPNHTYVAGMW